MSQCGYEDTLFKESGHVGLASPRSPGHTAMDTAAGAGAVGGRQFLCMVMLVFAAKDLALTGSDPSRD